MIYFIVNNDFHVEHIEYYTKSIRNTDLSIIRIPYSLKNDCRHLTSNIFTFKTPFRESMGFLKKYMTVNSIKRKIEHSLSFAQDDKVIILTEYDPLNQFIIYLAKKSNATTFMLQEGIATYYTNIELSSKKRLNHTERIKLFIIRYIYGFKYLKWVKLSDHKFSQMDDKYIDCLFLYFDVKLDRNIKTMVLRAPYAKLTNLNNNFALFLNQPLYESYLDEQMYFKILKIEILKLLQNYKKVIFKFHPRDHENIRNILKTSLDSSIVFAENDMNLDQVIEYYKPLNVYSFFSDALMRLELQGFKTHYLFQKQKDLLANDVLKNINSYLKNRIYPPVSNKKYFLREIYEIK